MVQLVLSCVCPTVLLAFQLRTVRAVGPTDTVSLVRLYALEGVLNVSTLLYVRPAKMAMWDLYVIHVFQATFKTAQILSLVHSAQTYALHAVLSLIVLLVYLETKIMQL